MIIFEVRGKVRCRCHEDSQTVEIDGISISDHIAGMFDGLGEYEISKGEYRLVLEKI